MDALVAYKGMVLTDNIEDYPEGIIIPIDKPYRWTSADVIRKVKYHAIKHFHKKNLKVGHAGTLDPLATGVLLVCIGKATKLAEELQRHDKEYLAGVTFGATTPSYDLEKEIDREYAHDKVSEESLRALLPGFIGPQEQIAPLFSAKSVDGVRAYEMARKLYKSAQKDGADFDHSVAELLSKQNIVINDMKLVAYRDAAESSAETASLRSAPPFAPLMVPPLTMPRVARVSAEHSAAFTEASSEPAVTVASGDSRSSERPAEAGTELLCSDVGRPGAAGDVMGAEPPSKEHSAAALSTMRANERIHVADISGYSLPQAEILVSCTKGTYIRALARDLGEALDSGAFLHSLRRTRNGGFKVEDALSVEDATTILDFKTND